MQRLRFQFRFPESDFRLPFLHSASPFLRLGLPLANRTPQLGKRRKCHPGFPAAQTEDEGWDAPRIATFVARVTRIRDAAQAVLDAQTALNAKVGALGTVRADELPEIRQDIANMKKSCGWDDGKGDALKVNSRARQRTSAVSSGTRSASPKPAELAEAAPVGHLRLTLRLAQIIEVLKQRHLEHDPRIVRVAPSCAGRGFAQRRLNGREVHHCSQLVEEPCRTVAPVLPVRHLIHKVHLPLFFAHVFFDPSCQPLFRACHALFNPSHRGEQQMKTQNRVCRRTLSRSSSEEGAQSA